MTHPLLTFLMTPMAAPETAPLRRMRCQWIALCWSLAASVLTNPLLTAILGAGAAVVPLLLCLAVTVHGIRYFTIKNRADAAHVKDEQP